MNSEQFRLHSVLTKKKRASRATFISINWSDLTVWEIYWFSSKGKRITWVRRTWPLRASFSSPRPATSTAKKQCQVKSWWTQTTFLTTCSIWMRKKSAVRMIRHSAKSTNGTQRLRSKWRRVTRGEKTWRWSQWLRQFWKQKLWALCASIRLRHNARVNNWMWRGVGVRKRRSLSDCLSRAMMSTAATSTHWSAQLRNRECFPTTTKNTAKINAKTTMQIRSAPRHQWPHRWLPLQPN